MRAGIGPVGHLAELGIPVIAGLPGVGQRLMDHPSIALSSFIRRGSRMNEQRAGTSISACATHRGCRASPKGDMFVAVVSKSAWHAVGEQIASLLTFINKTYSGDRPGQARLARLSQRTDRRVQLLSDKRDLDRLMSGFRLMAAVQMTDELKKVTDVPSPQPTATACGQSASSTPEQDPDQDRGAMPRRAGGVAPLHDR